MLWTILLADLPNRDKQLAVYIISICLWHLLHFNFQLIYILIYFLCIIYVKFEWCGSWFYLARQTDRHSCFYSQLTLWTPCICFIQQIPDRPPHHNTPPPPAWTGQVASRFVLPVLRFLLPYQCQASVVIVAPIVVRVKSESSDGGGSSSSQSFKSKRSAELVVRWFIFALIQKYCDQGEALPCWLGHKFLRRVSR